MKAALTFFEDPLTSTQKNGASSRTIPLRSHGSLTFSCLDNTAPVRSAIPFAITPSRPMMAPTWLVARIRKTLQSPFSKRLSPCLRTVESAYRMGVVRPMISMAILSWKLPESWTRMMQLQFDWSHARFARDSGESCLPISCLMILFLMWKRRGRVFSWSNSPLAILMRNGCCLFGESLSGVCAGSLRSLGGSYQSYSSGDPGGAHQVGSSKGTTLNF